MGAEGDTTEKIRGESGFELSAGRNGPELIGGSNSVFDMWCVPMTGKELSGLFMDFAAKFRCHFAAIEFHAYSSFGF